MCTLTILDSRRRGDAYDMDFDGPRDPVEDGEGLIVTREQDADYDHIILRGPYGYVEITRKDLRLIERECGRHDRREDGADDILQRLTAAADKTQAAVRSLKGAA